MVVDKPYHEVCDKDMSRTVSHISTRRPRISPLRYPGGKSALYPRLRAIIRDMGLAGCTYIEPYAGGVGAGLGLLVTGQVEHVIINDLDPAIYSFWKTLCVDNDWLIEQVATATLSIDEWKRQHKIYKAADTSKRRELGFATFYLNRTNRSGVLTAGPIGGFKQNGTYKINARFNRKDLCERIRILGLYSDAIVPIMCDGIDVINRYAGQKNTFIYADPPYFEKAKSLYLNAFQAEDHKALAHVLNNHKDDPWLLTYDDVPQVYELYKDRSKKRFQLNYSANKVMKATEVAVFSDTVSEVNTCW